LVEHLIELARHRGLRTTRLLRVPLHLPLEPRPQLGHVGAELVEEGNDDALVLCEECQEELPVVHERIAVAAGHRDGLVDCFCCLDCEPIRIDHRRRYLMKCFNRFELSYCAPMNSNVCTVAVCHFGGCSDRMATAIPRS